MYFMFMPTTQKEFFSVNKGDFWIFLLYLRRAIKTSINTEFKKMLASNFSFLLLVLYYLQDTDTAFWVKEIFPEEMTQKSGIILIKNAPGPWSHFFLQSIGVCDDEENL